MGVADRSRAHVEEVLAALEASYDGFPVNQTSVTVPSGQFERITAPLFVLHGANDPRVPVGEAEQIVAEVDEQGVPVEKLIFEDEGHGISKRENQIDAYTAVVDFLDEHV